MITRIRRLVLMPATVVSGLGVLAAVLLCSGLSPIAESAGPYNVGNSAVRIDIVQQGPCQPGAIETGNSIDASALPNPANPIQLRFTAPVNDSPGFRGCIAPRNGPQYLVIDNELFQYANIHTETGAYVDSTTQSFNMNVDNCYGYAPSDLIYVGMERMQWDTGVCDGPGGAQDYLHITARPDATDYAHGPRSFVRVHGLLLLVGRGGLPKFLDYATSPSPGILVPPLSDPIAYTPAAAHSAGALVHSPATYARCIDWLTQTAMSGDDTVLARTRCALISEPGYDASACDSTPSSCYWPTSPPLDPTVLRRPVFPLKASWNLTSGSLPPEYDELLGFIDDDGTGGVYFTYLPVSATGNCQLFFSLSPADKIYLSSDMSIPTGSKNFVTGSSGSGTLTVRYFVAAPGAPDPCGAGQYALTIASTFSFTKLALTNDTDGDGCEDVKEPAGSIDGNGQIAGQVFGGWRDPLNHYDYMNPTLDGVNRVDDIIAVVNKYHVDDTDSTPGFPPFVGAYNQDVDRTSIGPGQWNLGLPNGIVRVDDILAMVKSYHHDC